MSHAENSAVLDASDVHLNGFLFAMRVHLSWRVCCLWVCCFLCCFAWVSRGVFFTYGTCFLFFSLQVALLDAEDASPPSELLLQARIYH